MALIEVCVLGPLLVMRAGAHVAVPGGLATILIATLAVDQHRGTTDEELVERLWREPIPSAAIASLRNTVSRLRRLLGDGFIVRTASGYVLGPEVRIDLSRLEEHSAAARAATAAGDGATARRRVDAALALVRRPLLADVAGAPWAAPELSYWTELVAELGDRWIEQVADDADAEAIPKARELTVEHPEHEARWVHLARLLAATGRRTDALRALRQARHELAEFGLEPGPRLAAAEREALADRVAGSQVPRSARSIALIGRRDDLREVRAALSATAVVTLVGLGGVGKTRIALEVMLDPVAELPGGVTFVDLTAVTDRALVLGAITDAVGIRRRTTAGADAVVQLAEVLAAEPTLLVIDNAEQVADGVRAVVGDIRDALVAGGSRILVTSRAPIGVEGERVIVVEPLPVPDENASPAEVAASPAVELLAELSAPFTRADERADAARLVRAVAGLPLGVELVAALARDLPLAEVADGLDERILGLGAGRSRLRHVFDWVTERLHEDDLAVLARLSAFHGPFTLRSASAVVDCGDLDAPVVASLGHLRAAGLVSASRRRPVTYRLDAVQRAYVAELLAGRGETEVLARRVAEWYRTLALELAPRWRSHGQYEAIELMSAELANIRDLLHRLPRGGDDAAALDVAGALSEFWFLQGYWVEGAGWLDATLAAAPAPTLARAIALVGRARAGGTYARLADQEAGLTEAIELADAHARPDVAQEARLWRGLARLRSGGRREDAAAIGRLADDRRFPWVAAMARMLDGLGAARRGDVDRAREWVHDAAAELALLGDELAAADADKNLGLMLQRHGDGEEARRELHLAGLASGAAMPALVAQARYARAAIDVDQGRRDAEVVAELRAVRVDLRRVGDTTCLGGCNRLLAGLSESDDEALELLRDALPRLGADDEHELGLTLVDIGDRYVGAGRAHDAALLAAAADQLQYGTGYGWNRHHRARLAALVDATSAARARLDPALLADRDRLVRRAVRVAAG